MIRGLAAAAVAHAAPAALFVPQLRTPKLAGRGDPGHVALTFDDGPNPESTPQFLRALEKLDVRATFFVLGRELAAAPELGREIAAAGHEIAVHGWDHRCFLRRSPKALHDDLTRTVDLIELITGTRPQWLRAPYGVFSASALVSAHRLGLRPVLWTTWGFDWTSRATPRSVVRTVCRRLNGGGTILLHDSDVAAAPGAWRSALGAVPVLVSECRERGLAVGPLREHASGALRGLESGVEVGRRVERAGR
ncbi:polysaccharide deacetylase family protein [Amycolatopsis sp. AA4]|uniref:polysaccharide deacetylase family protein n=1 Tax=Streptomyces sp. AA4 TaxID=591158 RepID=UPI0001DEEA0F|nr:polysaccharide deacetylase family protein [Streptomyces sp. AA4]ATY16770.1 polysaccharide deacetylase family protein [Amycolatopsis sp. AA4]EFL10891.1 polysaccharide deacetylase family sporulation protein PdaB [Streptomyces sp. AA4]